MALGLAPKIGGQREQAAETFASQLADRQQVAATEPAQASSRGDTVDERDIASRRFREPRAGIRIGLVPALGALRAPTVGSTAD